MGLQNRRRSIDVRMPTIEYFELAVSVAWAEDVLAFDEIAGLAAVATLLELPVFHVAAADRPRAKIVGRHAAPMSAVGSVRSESSTSPCSAS